MSATEAVVACGYDLAEAISEVLGVFVGGRDSIIVETLRSEEEIRILILSCQYVSTGDNIINNIVVGEKKKIGVDEAGENPG